MNKSRNRVGGTLINWITIVAQIVISLFFIPFFLKTVGDRQYGLYSFSISVISWIDILLVASASAYYKFLTREKKLNGEYGEARMCGVFFKVFIIVAILILVFGLGFDILIYFDVIKLKEYSLAEKNQICLIILLSIFSTFVSTLLTVRKSYHYYKQKYVLIYSLSLFQIVLQATLSVVLLKLGYGVIAVAIAHFGSSILLSIILGILAKFLLKEKVSVRSISKEDKEYRKKLFIEVLVFSSFVIINTVVDLMNKTLDKTILGFYNADSVANYQLAYTLPSYLISFTSILSIVFEQPLNDAYYNGNGIEDVNKMFLRISKIQTFLTFLIVGGFVACGREFIFMWLDDSRLQVYYVACILMLTYSITCCNRLAISARRVQNLHIKASFIYLGIALVNIALSLVLVNVFPRENAIWACVIGTASTYIIGHWVVMQIYDKKVVKLSVGKFCLDFLKDFVIAGTIAVAVIFLFGAINISSYALKFVLEGLVFAVVYVTISLLIDKNLYLFFKQKISSLICKIKKPKVNSQD